MEKEIKYNMGKSIFEKASKPLRSRQEVILLLLYTIRMFDVDEFIPENKRVQVAILINKMNRIFYILEDKIFSIQFPFYVETQGEKISRIYDAKTGLDIDSMLVSTLIGLFEKINIGNFSIDSFFDEIVYSENNLQNIKIDQIWEIVKFISTYDLGYIRYCFLQALFGQNCKIFLDIVAKRFWTLLHVQIGQSCNDRLAV